jgi:Uma2 family endonuclease
MAKALDRPPGRMTVEVFLDWMAEHGGARYELVFGEIVGMAPEWAAHAALKSEVWLAVREAIRARSLPCRAFPDGMTIRIDDHTAYEPDAVVHCGDPLAADDLIIPSPVIVVEVLSPTTRALDTGGKLADYFRVPSIQHYLLVLTEHRSVIHHRRTGEAAVDTRIVTAGALDLDPPGLTLDIDRIYDDAALPAPPG